MFHACCLYLVPKTESVTEQKIDKTAQLKHNCCV